MKQRVHSIDVLRGFDMLAIIFLDKFFWTLDNAAQNPITGFMAKQFQHTEWFGTTFYNIIMPLFLFVVGAVIPFSLSDKYRANTSRIIIYRKLVRRVLILWILGWVVQGRLLELNIDVFQIYSNTLQAIAVGYFFTCLAYLHLNKKMRYLMFVSCLVIYILLLTVPYVPGEGRSLLLPDKNFPIYFDRLILGRFSDGYQYPWILSGFGFIASTMTGLFAGELIKSALLPKKVMFSLILWGLGCVSFGLILNIYHPIVKKLWTSSFVLFSSGICFFMLALFYWVIDIKKRSKWALFLKVIGMNAIIAYVFSSVFDFSKIANQVLFGLEQYTGDYYEVITVSGGFGILYIILWYMYKNKVFVKI